MGCHRPVASSPTRREEVPSPRPRNPGEAIDAIVHEDPLPGSEALIALTTCNTESREVTMREEPMMLFGDPPQCRIHFRLHA
jgi:hypothetical protein